VKNSYSYNQQSAIIIVLENIVHNSVFLPRRLTTATTTTKTGNQAPTCKGLVLWFVLLWLIDLWWVYSVNSRGDRTAAYYGLLIQTGSRNHRIGRDVVLPPWARSDLPIRGFSSHPTANDSRLIMTVKYRVQYDSSVAIDISRTIFFVDSSQRPNFIGVGFGVVVLL
jgi:hypothetical protein